MRIDLNAVFQPAKHVLLRFLAPTLIRPISSAVANSPSSVVTISDAARQASIDKASERDYVSPSEELRALVKQYDFHNIAPLQMSTLGGELRKRYEISDEVAGSFISVEMNTFVPMDKNKPIDMIAHFKMMQDAVENAALSDASLSFAVANRRAASKALEDVISFANSDRLHV